MEKTFSPNSLKPPKNGEPNVSRKRRSEVVEESPSLQTSAPLPTNLFPLPPQPSTSLHLDLNASPFPRPPQPPSTSLYLDLNGQLLSNSVEVNSTTSVPGQAPFNSHPSLINEDDDQDSLPQYIREQMNGIDQIIKQQGQQLTNMFANQQTNIYKMVLSKTVETARKELKEMMSELNKAKFKILELENMVQYLKGQIEKVQSNNQQFEGMLELYKNQLALVVNRKENAEASRNSTAQQQEVAESCHGDLNQAGMPRCKVCGKGLPRMILWPCHHLCLCKQCEVDTQTCPCCGTTKLSSCEVFFPQQRIF